MPPPPSVTTRSRTGLFLSYRDSQTRPYPRRRRSAYVNDTVDADADADDDDERAGLMHSAAARTPDHRVLDINLPPQWVDFSDQVNDILQGTRSKIAALDKLHAKHVLPGFADRTAEEREIELTTQDITKGFQRCQSLIQRISAEPSDSHAFPPVTPSRQQVTAAQNVQRALAAKVQDLSASFRKKQRVYMDKLKGHAIKNQDLLVASGAISLTGSDGMTALDDDIRAASQQYEAQQLVEPDLRARDRELTEIAKSIAQLAELFKDLGSLVIDQGTILDSVEYNIEQTAVHVEEAVKELNVATRYQRNTGRRQCIFLLLLIILGLILVLIFKPRRYAAAIPSTPSPSVAAQRLIRGHTHEFAPP